MYILSSLGNTSILLFPRNMCILFSPGNTNIQTSLGYTSPDLPLRLRPLKTKRNTLKSENNESSQGLFHNGEELHNGFA